MTNTKQEILVSSREYIIKIIDSIKESVEKMRANQLLDAYNIISDMTKGMDWLVEAIAKVKSELLEPIEVSEINKTLSELIESMQDGDYVLASDILEYELLEVLTKWETVLEESYNEKCNAV